MNITVNFESLEEFQKYMGQQPVATIVMSGEAAKAMAASAEDNAKKIKKAAQEAQEAPAEAEETGTAEEETVDVDALKVEVRKLLTKVNKQTGKNQAKEWIKNLGHDSLKEVEELDDLKALKALAEEELGA